MKWIWTLLTLALGWAVTFDSQAAHEKLGHKPGEDLFVEEKIPDLEIQLSDDGMERLRQHARTYILATVREGNLIYTNVSVRLKGGPGSFRPLDDKPAFTLNFSRAAEGQKFHGLKKLHLNNSVQDHSYLSEKIARELFEAAGVPAPRAGHAYVALNGQTLGMYVLVEGINKQFLSRYFTDPEGNLYDGHSQQDVTHRMPTNSGENPKDQSGLRALAAAAQETDLGKRLKALEQTLDLDRFISFVATEVIVCHWDGYAMNRNNFRIYHDRALNRMVFLPQGVDQTFQRPAMPVFPQMAGLVAKAALEIPDVRERYRERMTQLLTNVYQLSALTNHVGEVAAKVQARLAAADPQEALKYQATASTFARRIQRRVRFLEHQLLPAEADVKFDPNGTVALKAWQPQVDLGNPVLRQEDPVKERGALLSIRAEEGGAGSWRTRVWLDKGHYRFEGRVLVMGVKLNSKDPKAGVGLRISRKKFGRATSGDAPWTNDVFEFDVPEDRTEVELVCELRANQGEVWFDRNSLKLTRRD